MTLCACGWGPGMRLDTSAVKARAKQNLPPEQAQFAFVSITPEVVAEQQKLPAGPPRNPDPLADGATTYEYRVAPFDVLSVIVWGHPELTIPAGEMRSEAASGNAVTSDGHIFYPYVGKVPVAGKTLPEIRELLTRKLSATIENPQLDVRVAAFRSHKVVVTGEVRAPKMVPVTDIPLRVLDAITEAGGAAPEADLQRVVLTRGGKWHLLDLQAAMEEGDLSQNWLLADGDVLHVPDRSLKKVFVVGEVRAPATRFMNKSRLSLAEALSESGWLDPTNANAGGIFVIRGDYEKPKVFHLDAESPDALLLASAFPLRPLDVVFVSTHRLTQWNRILAQILPTISAISQPAFALRGIYILTNPDVPQ